ncbi:hypothetical protein [Nostoc sp. UIC 10630]|nr:hypothetical protein [Nostoc sp. UIC 10630]NEU79846.1 hypothetical protein [Nostoc sp. UIC 10630]
MNPKSSLGVRRWRCKVISHRESGIGHWALGIGNWLFSLSLPSGAYYFGV